MALSPVWYSCYQAAEAQKKSFNFDMAFPEKFDLLRLYDIEYKMRNTSEDEEFHRLMKAFITIHDAYLNYEPLPIEHAPTRMYTSDPRLEIKDIHQKFHGFFKTLDGYKILTEEGYQLIQQFNLGQGTQFFPIRLYHYETNQPINNETYYLMCLTDWRNYLLPEFCEGELYDFSTTKGGVISNWLTPGDEFNDAIALSSEASNCDLDLWHDPALHGSLFMSDRLKQALEQVGFLPCWHVLSTVLIYKQ
ncbi:hypothetical protein P256_00092 [Acinetobacter nectaris CIP 110549]|uniref:Uncharacterized protein n=1 Tax=Acinetobacter nectaris CIP 110549 TaxID=1392540 RepID=V2TU77_9GAMM|nr:hypothetical protein [Acinetobacter nectaris]ESK41107.1 hypothetical protein P256_00092 [Acinetobacter nectaris CIP 110549]